MPASVTQLLEAAETQTTTRIRVLCAVADAQLAKGDKAGAGKSLEQAVALAGTLGEAPVVPLPDLKTLFESQGKPRAGLPDPASARAKTQALADVAFVQSKLGQSAEGWTSLQQALNWTRAMAPSSAATQQLLDDCEKSGTKAQLMAIAPRNAKEVLVVGQYRRQCQALHDAATARLNLQLGLLKEAALRGHLAAVWQLARAQDALTELAVKEPFLTGERPPLLSMLMMQAEVGDKALAGEIKTFLGERTLKSSTLDWTRANLPGLLSKAASYGPAAEAIRREQKDSPDGKADPFTLDEIVLRNLSKVQAGAPIPAFLELIRQTDDPTLKEDAFIIYAGLLGQQNKADQLLTAVKENRALEVTHKLAIHRGLVESQP
jgi:hypothetical protein